MAKQQSCSISFSCLRQTQTVLIYGELQLFFLRQAPTVLVTANSTFFLFMSNSTSSCCIELKVFYSTLQRVYSTPSAGPSILHTYFMKSPVSGPFIDAYSMKSSIILYSALCSRTSLYPVSRIYTALSTLYSALLCNSEIPLRILIQ